jgi:hypothetical protein
MTHRETGRMAGTTQMRAPSHYLRVDLGEAAEAEYWMVVFDATREQLESAVSAVGCDALDVAAALNAPPPANQGIVAGPSAGLPCGRFRLPALSRD